MQNCSFFESTDKVFTEFDGHIYCRLISGGQWRVLFFVDTATRQDVQREPVSYEEQIMLDFAYDSYRRNFGELLFANPVNTQAINDIPTTQNATLSSIPPVLDTAMLAAANTGSWTPPHDTIHSNTYPTAVAGARPLVLPPSDTTITPPPSDKTHSTPSSSSSDTRSLTNEPESSGPPPFGYNKTCFRCADRKVKCCFEAGRSICEKCIKSNSKCARVPKQKPGRKRKGG